MMRASTERRGYLWKDILQGQRYLVAGLNHLIFCVLSEPLTYMPLILRAMIYFVIFYGVTYLVTSLLVLPFQIIFTVFEGLWWTISSIFPGMKNVELPEDGEGAGYGLFRRFRAMMNRIKRLFLWTVVGETPLLGYHFMRWLNSDPIDQLFGKLVQARIDQYLSRQERKRQGLKQLKNPPPLPRRRYLDTDADEGEWETASNAEKHGYGHSNLGVRRRGYPEKPARGSPSSPQGHDLSTGAVDRLQDGMADKTTGGSGGIAKKRQPSLAAMKAYAHRVKDRIAFMILVFFASQIPIVGSYVPLVLPFYYMRRVAGKKRALATNVVVVGVFVGFVYLYVLERKIRTWFGEEEPSQELGHLDGLFNHTVGKIDGVFALLQLTSSFLLDLVQFLDTQVYFSHEIFQAFRNYVNLLRATEGIKEMSRKKNVSRKREKAKPFFNVGFSAHADVGDQEHGSSSSEGEDYAGIPEWSAGQSCGPKLHFSAVKPSRPWFASHQGIFFGYTWPVYLLIEILWSPFFLPVWKTLLETSAVTGEQLGGMNQQVAGNAFPMQMKVLRAFEVYLKADYPDPWATFWWGIVWHVARFGDFCLRWFFWPLQNLLFPPAAVFGAGSSALGFLRESVTRFVGFWILAPWAVETIKLFFFLMAQMATVPLVVDEAIEQEWTSKRFRQRGQQELSEETEATAGKKEE